MYKHDQVKVRLSTLELSDLRYLLPEMTEKQHYLLSKGWRLLRDEKRGGSHWTANELVKAIRAAAGGEEGDRDDSGTVGALEWKIQTRFGENEMVFSASKHLELRGALPSRPLQRAADQ